MSERLNMQEALQVAEEAARRGGQVIRDYFGKAMRITMKRGIEEQIPVDTESEKAIISVLHDYFPDHRIQSEESGNRSGNSLYTWVIDPLDGTSNFILGIPQVAVCVTLVKENDILLTVIHQPILDTFYTAISGQGAYYVTTLDHGAYFNRERLRVRQNASSLSKSAICRVLAYGMHNHKQARDVMNRLYGKTRRLLDTWAPSLDWCMLASGKVDGLVYVSTHLLRYDPGMVAGLFLFREAGGFLGDLEYGENIDNMAQVESVIAATSDTLLKEIWRTIDEEVDDEACIR